MGASALEHALTRAGLAELGRRAGAPRSCTRTTGWSRTRRDRVRSVRRARSSRRCTRPRPAGTRAGCPALSQQGDPHASSGGSPSRPDASITCSPAHALGGHPAVRRCRPDKVDVIPNGIDLADWTVARSRRRRGPRALGAATARCVVFTGRLEWEKGVPHPASRRCPRLRRRFPGLRLVVAGEGSQRGAAGRRSPAGCASAAVGRVHRLARRDRAGAAVGRCRRRRGALGLRAVRPRGARGRRARAHRSSWRTPAVSPRSSSTARPASRFPALDAAALADAVTRAAARRRARPTCRAPGARGARPRPRLADPRRAHGRDVRAGRRARSASSSPPRRTPTPCRASRWSSATATSCATPPDPAGSIGRSTRRLLRVRG